MLPSSLHSRCGGEIISNFQVGAWVEESWRILPHHRPWEFFQLCSLAGTNLGEESVERVLASRHVCSAHTFSNLSSRAWSKAQTISQPAECKVDYWKLLKLPTQAHPMAAPITEPGLSKHESAC